MLFFHFPNNMSPEALPLFKFFLWEEIWLTVAVIFKPSSTEESPEDMFKVPMSRPYPSQLNLNSWGWHQTTDSF